MGRGDQFCPRCGFSHGDDLVLSRIETVSPAGGGGASAAAAHVAVVDARGGTRTLATLGALAVAVVGLLVLLNRGSDSDEATQPSTTTTAPATATTGVTGAAAAETEQAGPLSPAPPRSDLAAAQLRADNSYIIPIDPVPVPPNVAGVAFVLMDDGRLIEIDLTSGNATEMWRPWKQLRGDRPLDTGRIAVLEEGLALGQDWHMTAIPWDDPLTQSSEPAFVRGRIVSDDGAIVLAEANDFDVGFVLMDGTGAVTESGWMGADTVPLAPVGDRIAVRSGGSSGLVRTDGSDPQQLLNGIALAADGTSVLWEDCAALHVCTMRIGPWEDPTSVALELQRRRSGVFAAWFTTGVRRAIIEENAPAGGGTGMGVIDPSTGSITGVLPVLRRGALAVTADGGHLLAIRGEVLRIEPLGTGGSATADLELGGVPLAVAVGTGSPRLASFAVPAPS